MSSDAVASTTPASAPAPSDAAASPAAGARTHAHTHGGTRKRTRVGIVGYGLLGQYLVDKLLHDPKTAAAFELAFVWNRSADRLSGTGLRPDQVCRDLDDVARYGPDLIVEVCHPDVTKKWGVKFLSAADYYCGSPTALADPETEAMLREAARSSGGHGLYIPAGALWGAQDIAKMADRDTIGGLTITMKKHPASLKLEGELAEKLAAAVAAGTKGEVVLYQGSVRHVCALAPNNVNTMAAAAIAAHTLGFDGVQARLVSDDSLDAHVITIEVRGKPGGGGTFRVDTERYNPAPPGAITGSATYASFLSSLYFAGGRGAGVHLC